MTTTKKPPKPKPPRPRTDPRAERRLARRIGGQRGIPEGQVGHDRTLYSQHVLQMGRDPRLPASAMASRPSEWQAVGPQSWDLAPGRKPRVYHRSAFSLWIGDQAVPIVRRDGRGREEVVGEQRSVTWEEAFDATAELAAEFEEAGIDLGWGRCRHRGYLEPALSLELATAQAVRRHRDMSRDELITSIAKGADLQRAAGGTVGLIGAMAGRRG